MRAIDTNVIVRLVTRDDAAQTAAAERFVENGAWVSSLALAGAVWVLEAVYELRASAIATAIEMLLDHRHLTLQDSKAVASALEVFRKRPALGFSECLSLALAGKAGHLPLGTFDRELSKVAGAERL